MIVEKKLEINNKKKSEIEADLEKNKFPKHDNTYNYLLSMPLYNLTNEKIEELKKHEKDKQTEHDDLVSKKPEQLWMHDLLELETAYDKWTESKEKDTSNTSTNKKKKGLSISA